MYGTMFRMQPKPGMEQAVLDLFKPDLHDRVSHIVGLRQSYLLKSASHPGELVCLAVFEDEEKYKRNSNDPQQDQWYRELRALLQADPDWNDGVVIDNMESVRINSQ